MTKTVRADVAIVGAGIVGLSTAWRLQQAGKRVAVLERGIIGAEASGRNGSGVRQQGRVLPEMPLARAAIRLWGGLDAELGRPTGYRRNGHLYVAETNAEMDRLVAMREAELPTGLVTELIGPNRVKELAPGITDAIVGAKYCPEDGSADASTATTAIAAAAEEAGAQIFCHQPAVAMLVEQGRMVGVASKDIRIEAPIVLIAAGPWSPYVAQLADVYLPIYPSRAVLMRTEALPPVATPFVQTASMDMAVLQLADGTVRMGAAADAADYTRFTYDKSLAGPIDAQPRPARAITVFPALAEARLVGMWAGIRECTPDMMPILGPVVGPEGLLVAAGFSGHGFALGPLAGRLMSDWIVKGDPGMDLSAFAYRRFLRRAGPLSVVQLRVEQTG